MQRTSGFSLIEVLVVIAITSTLAVGATLIWSRDAGNDADTTAFAQDLTGLQRRAMLSGVDHRLVLDTSGWQAERRGAGGWERLPGSQQMAHIYRGPRSVLVRADGRVERSRIIFGKTSDQSECRTGGGDILQCRAM